MILAHGVGGTGPEIELLILGAGLVLFAAFKGAQKRSTNILVALVGAGMLVAAFVLPKSQSTRTAPSDVAISIKSPVDNEVVPANEKVNVQVELENAALTDETQGTDPRLGHIHIYVDGSVVSMPTELNADIELEPGEHDLMVEYVAADHSRFEPPITDEVTVDAN